MAEDSHPSNVKLTKFDEEIARFDSVLDRIQKALFEDMKVYDLIVQIRDTVFRLQNQMRGLEIVEFAAPWIEAADLFWDTKKQNSTITKRTTTR